MKLLLLLSTFFSLTCLAQKVPKNISVGFTLPPTYIVTWIDQNGKDSVTYERDNMLPSDHVFISLINKYNNMEPEHRKHVLGMTFSTYPPIYSCAFYMHECSPYQLLPEPYQEMRTPFIIGLDIMYWRNGYEIFCDSLIKLHQNEDSFFMAKWNEMDTSCLSNEIAFNKSKNILRHWETTHPSGHYWLDKRSCMYFDNGRYFMYYYDTTGEFIMGSGGGYDDSTLLADKWYKVTLDKSKKKRKIN